ncbi:MAG TPA: WD40 repeat domain-containing protein [Kribbella sp.]
MSAPGTLVAAAVLPFEVGPVAWSPDGQWIAVGGVGQLGVVDAATGRLRWSVGEWNVDGLAVSPDGRRLAVNSHTGESGGIQPQRLRVLDSTAGREMWTIAEPATRTATIFSPDSSLLAFPAVDPPSGRPRVMLVETETGRPIRDLGMFPSGRFTERLAFSSDWRRVLSMRGNIVVLIDTETGLTLWEQQVALAPLSMAFSEDDRTISVIDQRSVTILKAEAGDVQRTVPLEGGIPTFLVPSNWGPLAFSPDRRRLVSASSDLRIFSLVDGARRFILPLQRPGGSLKVLFSPCGRHAAVNYPTADAPASLRSVLEVYTRSGAPAFQDTRDTTQSIAFNLDGTRIAVGGTADAGGGFVRVYDTGAELSRAMRAGPVSRVAVTTAGMRLLATASDDMASLFHADSGEFLLERRHPGVLTSIVFSPDGGHFATGCPAGVCLFQTVSGSPVWKLDHGTVTAVAISPGAGEWVATASRDHNARVVRRDNGEERWKLIHPSPVSHIAFSSDARWVATGAGRATRILGAVAGDEVHRVEHNSTVQALAFSPVGSLLATANNDGMALLIDASTGEQREPIPHPQAVTAVAFSPDGSLLATGGTDRTVRVFDLTEGAPVLLNQRTYDSPVTLLAFQPAGRSLAIATETPPVRIVDPTTGEELQRLINPAPVHHFVFGDDGDLFATACHDKTARVYFVR